MTQTAKDAYSAAYSGALNEFEDTIGSHVADLIKGHCAGQYRDDVAAMIENDDDLAADFLREALARIDKERQNRPAVDALVAYGADTPMTPDDLRALMCSPAYWRDHDPEVFERVRKEFGRLYKEEQTKPSPYRGGEVSKHGGVK